MSPPGLYELSIAPASPPATPPEGSPARGGASCPSSPAAAAAARPRFLTCGQRAYESELEQAREQKRKTAEYFTNLSKTRRAQASARPTTAYADLTPLNLEAARAAFLAQAEQWAARAPSAAPPRDPVFEYASAEAARAQMGRYGPPRSDLLEEATRILERGKKPGAWEDTGSLLSLEQAKAHVARYLRRAGVDEDVEVRWLDRERGGTPAMVTVCDPAKVRARGRLHLVRRPRRGFREGALDALLDHEVGTHFTRAANERRWGEYRKQFGGAFNRRRDGTRCYNGYRILSERELLATEEGLATLNTLLRSPDKAMWSAALAYVARWRAATMGFAELFESLREWLPSPEQRWAQCVRSKRGLTDTSAKGAFAKDQCYLEGAWKILERRRDLHFDLLHSGLVAVEEHEDALKGWRKYAATVLSKQRAQAPILKPHFLCDMGAYLAGLDAIADANGVPLLDGPGVGKSREVHRGLGGASTMALLSRQRSHLAASPLPPVPAGGE